MFGDPPLSDETIAALLREEWRLSPSQLGYERIGYGSYHWRATAGGASWFVTADPAERPVAGCYELARRLAGEGLEVVRAPLATAGGAVVAAAGGWWVSVWPWLEGRSSDTGRHETPADLAAVAAAVRRLHDHPPGAMGGELVDGWAIEGWGRFEAAVATAGAGAGPYAGAVWGLLGERLPHVRELRARYDGLAVNRPAVAEWVVTHGEPHAANVVHTRAGSVLIDWDTVRLAPRERDLWMLALYDGWQDAYGGDGDASLLEAYRIRWDLTEIALFVPDLLGAAAETPDLDVAMEELQGYLEG